MQVELSLEALAIIEEAMIAAGDGGIDPFSQEDRALVEKELAPHADVVAVYGRKHRNWYDTRKKPTGTKLKRGQYWRD